jgi:hypothetical protein
VKTLAVEGQLRPVNPATLEPVGAVPVTSDIGPAVARSVSAQDAWSRSSFDRSVDGFKGVLELFRGDHKLRSTWTHRRGLFHLAKCYLRG